MVTRKKDCLDWENLTQILSAPSQNSAGGRRQSAYYFISSQGVEKLPAVSSENFSNKKSEISKPKLSAFPLSEKKTLRLEKRREIFDDFSRGISMEALAQKYGMRLGSLYRILGPMRAEWIKSLKLDYIDSPEFREDLSPKEEREILRENNDSDLQEESEDEIVKNLTPRKKRRRVKKEFFDAESETGNWRIDSDDDFEMNYGSESERVIEDDEEELSLDLLQLGCRPLLSADEEKHLFRKMNYLKYKASGLREKMNTEGASARLMARIESLYREALAVKDRIVAANLRLVISIAKKRVDPSLSINELISDGNVSLMKAVEKFDYCRGNKFSTYATWAIERNFLRSIPDEKKYLDRFHASEMEVIEPLTKDRGPVSQEIRVYQERVKQINQLMNTLNDREQTILKRRFGLGEYDKPQTLRQVGKEIGVTKERVRQIEIRALEKLQNLAIEKKMQLPEII